MVTDKFERHRSLDKGTVVFSPCSEAKNDSVPIPPGSRVVHPSYYVADTNLLQQLVRVRQRILQDPRANVGTKVTYAFDLYVLAGNAYKHLKDNVFNQLKSVLLSSEIEWLFLSGGYGVIHALEPARKYRATFNRSIAYRRKIPFTTSLWKVTLSSIFDSIVSRFNPRWVYVFGSRDYTAFIKQTNFWRTSANVKMFENTGSSGPYWLSPRLNDLANAMITKNLIQFNQKYTQRFYKQ